MDLENARKLFLDSLSLVKKNILNLVEEITNELKMLKDELLKVKSIINADINIKKRI